jgi:MFS family permease
MNLFLKIKTKKSSTIFFGWWTVLVTGVISGLGNGFYQYGISVFFKDLAAELELNRAVTSLGAGIGRLQSGITSPLIGCLVDKYGPKWVIFTGICLSGIGMILMNFVNCLWQYIIVWGIFIGVGLIIGLTVAVDKALNDWFILKRGLAQGTKFALIGVGSVIVLPVVTLLVTSFGWRITCLIWGCLMLACSPLALIFVKQRRPEYYGLLPDGDLQVGLNQEDSTQPPENKTVEFLENKNSEFSFKQAVKTQAYWLLAFAFGVQMLIIGGINVHIIPLLTDIGFDRATAGILMTMMIFFTIPSRFLGGVLSDMVGKKNQNYLLAGGFLIQTLGFSVFLLSKSAFSVYIFLGLYGFSSGASTPLFILILGSYFGRKAFGSIFGSSMAICAPISLFAPVFSGWVYDRTGNYTTALIFFTVCGALAVLLTYLVRPVEKTIPSN